MHEIDLIPAEYHRQRRMTGWLRLAVLSLLAIAVLNIGGFSWLKFESKRMRADIEQLQSQKAITNAHRTRLEQLENRRKELDQQLQLLAGLRSGAAAERMFTTIDRALPAQNVWLTGWRFRRAGTPVEQTDQSVNTGYFIVIPQQPGNNRATQETWKIETRMSIQGQSMDHAALSEFVLNLTRQPEIEDVRVVNTQLAEINQVKLVNFNLEILVATTRSKLG